MAKIMSYRFRVSFPADVSIADFGFWGDAGKPGGREARTAGSGSAGKPGSNPFYLDQALGLFEFRGKVN